MKRMLLALLAVSVSIPVLFFGGAEVAERRANWSNERFMDTPLRQEAAAQALLGVAIHRSDWYQRLWTPAARIVHLEVNTGRGCCQSTDPSDIGCPTIVTVQDGEPIRSYAALVRMVTYFGLPTSIYVSSTCAEIKTCSDFPDAPLCERSDVLQTSTSALYFDN